MPVTWTFLSKFFVVNIVLPAVDVATDAWTAAEFLISGEKRYFWLTTALVFLPALTCLATNLFSFLRQPLAFARNADSLSELLSKILVSPGIRIPLVQQVRSAWLFAKLWKLKQTGRDQLDRARELQKIKEESAAVSLTEAFGESAPQLLLQLTIVLANGRFAGLAQLISVVISWISLVFNSGRLFLFLRDGDHQIAHPPLVTSLKLAVLFLCPVSHLFLAFALAIVTFGKKYGLVLLFVWVLLKGLTSGSSLRSKHFAITFISSWIVPFSTQSRASFSSRHSIEFSNILKRKPTSLGRDMWAYFLFAQGILLSTIWLRANLDAQVSPFTGCVEVTDIVTSCATFVGGRLFNATSCFPEFWGTDSDNPPQIVRVCPSYSNDNTANYYFGGFAVGLFVLTLISLAFLNSLTTDVQLYKQLGLVTSSAIKDLMLEKFLKDRILGVENSGFFQTLVLCGRRVQTSDELLRKMIDSATLEMLIEPGVVSGVSCLEAASDKGFLDLVERMRKRGHWEPDHALNGGIFETGTPVREGKHFVLKIILDNETQRYTVTIEKHSQDTNENETGKTIADELESDFEIPRAMGLVKELSTFFWHFPPPSAGFAKEWYEIYKSLIQANYVRSREASEREQSSAVTNDRTDQDFNERSPLLRRP